MKFIPSSILVLVVASSLQHPGNAAKRPDPLLEEFGSHQPKATFYDEEFFNGGSTDANLAVGSKCRNLPSRWRGKPLSVDTSGTCVAVCTALDCGGDCVRVYPNTGDLRLSTVGMDRKVTSLKSCF